MSENKFYKGELQDDSGAVMHPKTVAEQVYHSDGKTTEQKMIELIARIENQVQTATATYFNRKTGGNVEGPVSSMDWGTFSAGSSGIAVIAENAYINKDRNTYHYKNTHSGLGARGIVMHPNSGLLWFDTGNVATTADAQFYPALRPLQAGQTAVIHNGDMNDLTDTGFFNGSQMANAPTQGWFYLICIGHSYDPTTYRMQIAIPFEGTGVYYRVCSGVWYEWQHFVTSNSGGSIRGGLNIIGNAAPLQLIGSDHIYLPFFKNGVGSVRSGYIGYGDGADPNFTINNEIDGGAVKALAEAGFWVVGAGIYDNGVRVPRTYISTAEPTAADGVDGDVWHQYV